MSELNQASGVVQEFGKTQSGTPKLKVGGSWYFLSRNLKGAEPKLGTSIQLKYSLFGDKNDLRAIEAWRITADTAAPRPSPAAPQSAPVDADLLRYISNVVANAITAGAIKEPKHIKAWVSAAKASLQDGPIPGRDDQEPEEEEFNDDIPF